MKPRASYLLLIATLLLLFAFPAQAATYQTFVLTNEGVNGLVSQLISDGYGNYNLYDALVVIQANTNPSVAGIITRHSSRHFRTCRHRARSSRRH